MRQWYYLSRVSFPNAGISVSCFPPCSEFKVQSPSCSSDNSPCSHSRPPMSLQFSLQISHYRNFLVPFFFFSVLAVWRCLNYSQDFIVVVLIKLVNISMLLFSHLQSGGNYSSVCLMRSLG